MKTVPLSMLLCLTVAALLPLSLPAIAADAALALAGQVTIKTVPYQDRPSIVMENGLARVVILPSAGGRVIEYSLLKSGHNQLVVVPRALLPDGRPENGGGIVDLVGEQGCVMWPGDFMGADYRYSIDEKSGRVTLSAERGSIRIERTLTLAGLDTRLDLDVKYWNISKEPMNLLVRVNPMWNVGGGEAGDDYAFFYDGGRLSRARCIGTAEMPFSEYYPAEKGWWFVGDAKTREALACIYDPAQVRNVLRWGGSDRYTFELVGRKTRVLPGDAASLQYSYHLIDGPAAAERITTGIDLAERRSLIDLVAEFLQKPDAVIARSLDRTDRIRQLAKATPAGKSLGKLGAGMQLNVYRSAIDDTYQPYVVYVPSSYTPKKTYPLVLVLHGADGTERTELLASDLAAEAERRGYILASPWGRGQFGVWGIGEDDALSVLRAVQKDYKIDPDRVFATGISMGGFGSWTLGIAYPDLFAGIAPICGTGQEDFAENLRHVPVYIIHGTRDAAVKVAGAREMDKVLRELLYDVTYREYPQYGHGVFVTDLGELFDWMDRRRRVTDPSVVTYRTDWLRHHRAYWVSIDGMIDSGKPAGIEAKALPGNQLAITTDNVAKVTFNLPGSLFNFKQPLRVYLNGKLVYLAPPYNRSQTLYAQTEDAEVTDWVQQDPAPTGLRKTPELSGPIWHVPYATGGLIVYGTTGTAEETAANKAEAEKAANFGVTRFYKPIMKADKDVTAGDIQRYNLVLFGGPASNALTAKIQPQLPLRIDGQAVFLGNRRFEGKDVGYRLVYPNPLNPARLVVINAGVSAEAMTNIRAVTTDFDFVVFDNRAKQTPAADQPPPPTLAHGFFDRYWQLPAEN